MRASSLGTLVCGLAGVGAAAAGAVTAVLNPTAGRPGGGVGRPLAPGTELRILCAGDSITAGTLSDGNGGDGNGYRRQLQADLLGASPCSA